MEEEKGQKPIDKRIIIGLSVVAGIILVIGIYAMTNKDTAVPETKDAQENATTSTEDTTVTINNNVSPKNKVTTKNETAPTPMNNTTGKNLKSSPEIYQAALKQYGDLRIQMDNCQAVPFKLTVKNGTTILLDGFSPDPQRITIGNKTVTLNGLDAKPITIQGEARTTLTIDCEYSGTMQYNTGEIVVMP